MQLLALVLAVLIIGLLYYKSLGGAKAPAASAYKQDIQKAEDAAKAANAKIAEAQAAASKLSQQADSQ